MEIHLKEVKKMQDLEKSTTPKIQMMYCPEGRDFSILSAVT